MHASPTNANETDGNLIVPNPSMFMVQLIALTFVIDFFVVSCKCTKPSFTRNSWLQSQEYKWCEEFVVPFIPIHFGNGCFSQQLVSGFIKISVEHICFSSPSQEKVWNSRFLWLIILNHANSSCKDRAAHSMLSTIGMVECYHILESRVKVYCTSRRTLTTREHLSARFFV